MVQHDYGWLYLNLNHTLDLTTIMPGACDSDTGYFGEIAQSWVTVSLDHDEIGAAYNVGFAAVQLATACDTGLAGSPLVDGMIGDPPTP